MSLLLDQERRQIWVIAARVFARAQAWCLSRISDAPIWVDTQGTPMTYAELSNGHLRNIIRKMRREGGARGPVWAALQEEANQRQIRPAKKAKRSRSVLP